MSQPKVSVVVPIYGVEKYLHQCVDSILAQTLEDIEVILVDDGSKDKCPEIIDEYAAKDKRVVALHQPNGGYGRAVNHGIEVAKGEYIGIIESDDWIEPTMYEKLYKNAKENNTDVTKGGFYIYNSFLPKSDQNKVYKYHYRNLDEAPDSVFSVSDYPLILSFHSSIWSSIYKADFIKQQKVIESRSASYQDFPFMVETFCRAKRITVVKEALVHYRMEERQNSSTIRRDERLIMMPKQCIAAREILKKYSKYDELKEEFYYHCYMACAGFYTSIYQKYKREYFNKLHELFAPLKNDNQFKFKYFDTFAKKVVLDCINNHFYNSLLKIYNIRKFLLSFRFHKGDFFIQVLGIQIYNKDTNNRPALIKIKV